MTRQISEVYLSPSTWENRSILFYLKPTTPQTCHVFKYISQLNLKLAFFFLPNNRTADHVFTFRTLKDKLVTFIITRKRFMPAWSAFQKSFSLGLSCQAPAYVYGYIGLCRAIYGYVGLCLTMQGNVWLCMPLQGCVRLCTAMQGYVWLCRAVYSYVGL